jgi:hypothetical protein
MQPEDALFGGAFTSGHEFQELVSDAEWVEARVAFMQLEAEHKAATIALAKKR